jgi:hypothetical protein
MERKGKEKKTRERENNQIALFKTKQIQNRF